MSSLIKLSIFVLVLSSAVIIPQTISAATYPNQSYSSNEVGKVIGHIHKNNGLLPGDGSFVLGINQVLFHQGYMLAPLARNAARRGSGSNRGAMAVFDITNPRSPQRIFWRQDTETNEIREAHGHVLSSGHIWCINAINGVQFWDLSNAANPVLLSNWKSPDMSGTNTYGATGWWVMGQHPYYYLGVPSKGLIIIDGSDPRNPSQIRLVTRQSLNLGSVGSVHCIGNLMVLGNAGNGKDDFATLDISDPRNPVLLDRAVGTGDYSVGVYGNWITTHGSRTLQVWDMSDPTNLRKIHERSVQDSALYSAFQDGYFHGPMFDRYERYSLPTLSGPSIKSPNGPIAKTYEFVNVLGNLIIGTGGGNGDGAKIVPTSASRDTTAPEVNFVSPKDGATEQALSSRIGVILTDVINFETLSTNEFRLRKVGQSGSVAGHFSFSRNYVNFTPAQPLDANSTYEISIRGGGITDLMGNGIRAFTSRFQTVSLGNNRPIANAGSDASITLPAGHTLTGTATDPDGDTLDISWSKVSGPGSVVFSNHTRLNTTVSFDQAGTYTLRLSVSDGQLVGSDELRMVVNPAVTFRQPDHPGTTSAGLRYDYYEANNLSSVNNLSGTPKTSGTTSTIDTSHRQRDDNFGLILSGYLSIANRGTYTFTTSSDDGSTFSIGDTLVVDNDGLHGTRSRSGSMGLEAGLHRITIKYFEATGGQTLAVTWDGPEGTGTIPAQVLRHVPSAINRPPTVAAGPDQTIRLPAAASLNATATDADGDPLTFTWTSNSGPASVSFTPATSLSSIASFTTPGSYSLTITANDGQTAADDQVTITVLPAQDTAPLAIHSPPSLAPVEIDTTLQWTVQATGGTGPLRYSYEVFDPVGNNLGQSPWSSTPDLNRSLQEPGHYRVIARARDDLSTVSTTFTQIIHLPLTSNKPTATTPILVSTNGSRVWNVNPDNNTVTVSNPQSRQAIAEIAVPADPRTLAEAADGSIWVSCHDGDQIAIINAQTLQIDQHIALPRGAQAVGIVMDRSKDLAYVSLHGLDQIRRFSTTTRQETGRLATADTPHGMALDAAGRRLYVAHQISPQTHGTATVINADDFSISTTISLQISDAPDTIDSGRGIPNYLGHPAISPDGARLLIPAKQDNIERGLIRDGRNSDPENIIRAILAQINTSTQHELYPARIDINDADMPQASCFDATGTIAFVALQGINAVAIHDLYGGAELARLTVGFAPQGLAYDDHTKTLYVHSFLSRQVDVLHLASLLALRSTQADAHHTISTVANELLAQQVLIGKRHFYHAGDERMSSNGYISCASCHLDGGQDGRILDFTERGEGLRNTISLRGRRGTGHGPVHWTANFDEIHDFEHDMRAAFGGRGFLSDAQFNTGSRNTPLGDSKAGVSADLDALAAYVSSLDAVPASPYRDADGHYTAAAQRGAAHFKALRCADCHSGADFTDSATGRRHDVGTLTAASGQRLGANLDGLDTPTLKGIWNTAPYFHDGSAASLEAVLQRSGSAHGHANQLSATEQAELVAYLKQLDETSSNPGLPPSNIPPISHAGANQTLTDHDDNGSEAVALDGTRSIDSDGTIVSWEWLWSGGSATGNQPIVTLPRGTTSIQLTVTDNLGAQHSDTVLITINAPSPPQAGAGAWLEDNGLIVMEAEDAQRRLPGSTGDNWQFESNRADYAGRGFVRALNNNGTNHRDTMNGAVLEFDVVVSTPGTWYLWVRMWGESGSDDSVHVGLDHPVTYGRYGLSDRSNRWAWKGAVTSRAMVNIPAAGRHTLRIWQREDGTRVDRFLLSTDAHFTPSGIGPGSSLRENHTDNRAPRIELGADQTITWPSNTLTLQATIADPDNDSMQINWIGPAGTTLTSADQPRTEIQFAGPGTYTITAEVSDGILSSTDSLTVTVEEAVLPPVTASIIAVNCGGPEYTARDGTVYLASSSAMLRQNGGRNARRSNAVGGTEDDPIYQSERYGDVSYAIDVPNGSYELTLHFCEIYWRDAGKRIFDVHVEEQVLVNDLDIYATTGDRFIAYDISQSITITDGVLNIRSTTIADNAQLSGFRLAPSVTSNN